MSNYIGVLILVLALGIVGRMDYDDAKMMEEYKKETQQWTE